MADRWTFSFSYYAFCRTGSTWRNPWFPLLHLNQNTRQNQLFSLMHFEWFLMISANYQKPSNQWLSLSQVTHPNYCMIIILFFSPLQLVAMMFNSPNTSIILHYQKPSNHWWLFSSLVVSLRQLELLIWFGAVGYLAVSFYFLGNLVVNYLIVFKKIN